MLRPTAKILVPTDFSEYRQGPKAGLDIAKQYGAKLYLLHVVEELHRLAIVDYPIPEEVPRSGKKGD